MTAIGSEQPAADALREVAGAGQRLRDPRARRAVLGSRRSGSCFIQRAHFGVGSDGILLLARPRDERHVAELRIFNLDGSEAELSGNGAREAVLYLRAAGWTGEDTFTILTKAGEVTPTITGPAEVSMAIGAPRWPRTTTPRGGDDGTGTLSAGAASGASSTSTSATLSA